VEENEKGGGGSIGRKEGQKRAALRGRGPLSSKSKTNGNIPGGNEVEYEKDREKP